MNQSNYYQDILSEGIFHMFGVLGFWGLHLIPHFTGQFTHFTPFIGKEIDFILYELLDAQQLLKFDKFKDYSKKDVKKEINNILFLVM